MNQALVDRITATVLYEGYILYPYRPSVKNRQRWTFGGLYPQAHCETEKNGDVWSNQTECLIEGTPQSRVTINVRFLHLTARQAGRFAPPLPVRSETDWTPYEPVQLLQAGNAAFHSWQEAQERKIHLGAMRLQAILSKPHVIRFDCLGKRWREPIGDGAGHIVGVLDRRQMSLAGEVELSCRMLDDGLFRLTVLVRNRTKMQASELPNRDEALLRCLVSAHTVLNVGEGEFVSLLDPPPRCAQAAAACKNLGVWPVLVGKEGTRHTLMASPIILYDYPQLAPESPGDFFDGTEIDEMLTLRIQTLTDQEKQLMAGVDERARALLARTDAMNGEQMSRLHGGVRTETPTEEACPHG